MFCRKCGFEMTDKMGFCPKCGNRALVEDTTLKCVKCGQQFENLSGIEFCPFCGEKVSLNKKTTKLQNESKKNHNMLAMIITLVVVVVVLFGVVGLCFLLLGDDKNMAENLDADNAIDDSISEQTNSDKNTELEITELNDPQTIMYYMNNEGYIVFGSYEQDGIIENGPEPIEWIVLDDNENGMLLISRYVLDCVSYSYNDYDTTWESSNLRYWLNVDFLTTAFSEKEIQAIKTMDDKLFCLNEADIEKYMYDADAQMLLQNAMATATAYALQNGVTTQTITYEQYSENAERTGFSSDVVGLEVADWWFISDRFAAEYKVPYIHYIDLLGRSSRVCQDGASNVTGIGVRPALYLIH